MKAKKYHQCSSCDKGVMVKAGFALTGILPDGKARWVQQWRCARRSGCGSRTVNPGPACDYDGKLLNQNLS